MKWRYISLTAPQIPLALAEIGRLREITFRSAGEGTGESRDLDRFDPHYLHLFVWNREKREIVGAYRIGDVPRLLARFRRKGLYTESLFRFSSGFLENLGPALELGRSFIRPEYQRQFTPLLLLWKGISAYVWQRPEYAILIGAVTVSNRYSQASRELIARYFEKQESRADRGAVKARETPAEPVSSEVGNARRFVRSCRMWTICPPPSPIWSPTAKGFRFSSNSTSSLAENSCVQRGPAVWQHS